MPGGCTIGVRPVNIHLDAFKKLGAKISHDQGYLVIKAVKLAGNRIKFPFPSVGATENLMMCACLVPGLTILENCAREPEICDLAVFLRNMGADIKGDGAGVIKINGVKNLCGARHNVISDRIETGTYMLACAAAGGKITLKKCVPEHLKCLMGLLRKARVKVSASRDDIKIESQGIPRAVSVKTEPYPGFPTDLQAQWLALMCMADGKSIIREEIFENRFMHAAELNRMGAQIKVSGNSAFVEGHCGFIGAPVMVSDLRAGAALVIAALAAKGRSEIRRVYHIDRGYACMEQKLRALGADIKRVQE